ncbi:MAG: hypothetical protein OEW42_06780 [Acidimicrobiia bacterium]|nr:hypothetical protein [Acidimicrobiia bacterium]
MRPGASAKLGERAALGGGEVLPLAFLLLVVAILVITNAWAVVDARLAASAASRESTRAAVEAPTDPIGVGERAGREALAAFGRGAAEAIVEVAAPRGLGRCAPVVTTVTLLVPAFSLPWVGGIGEVSVTARHHELIDPYRNDVPDGGCA